jgi:hypothetical protein
MAGRPSACWPRSADELGMIEDEVFCQIAKSPARRQ